MDRAQALARIVGTGVIAVVRLPSADRLVAVADALVAGGVDAVEFTMTTPGALEAIDETARALGERVVIGAGTVLDPGTARAAIEAGARFVVAPTTSHATVAECRRLGAIAIPGAFTPTEILTAWEWGADLVKVFPATGLGPRYLRDVLAPLPHVRLVPSGGVDLSNAAAFITAGAAAISVGSALVDPKAIASGDLAALTDGAMAYVAAVREARSLGASSPG